MTNLKTIVNPTTQSRLKEVDFESLPFGKIFSDHMFVIDYADGKWQQGYIMPYGDMPLSPATSALHYGQAIFEGMKCNRDIKSGDVLVFRPEQNALRFNISAARMGMPSIPVDIYLQGLYDLISTDRDWIPTREGYALYMRPFMFATDPMIGVRPSDTYRFMIITCPVGPYYAQPLKVLVADKYVRAFPGGTGSSKAAGNYAASMYPTVLAKKAGYDQVLWTDGMTHEYLEEIGTMNVFFVINNKAYTPSLDGTILNGITRDSIIQLLRHKGVEVIEKHINIHEIFEAHQNGTLQEAFGAGTAATITNISAIGYKDQHIELPPITNKLLSAELKANMNAIKCGAESDIFNWLVRI
ncbi:MAG: branched-chain amino acid aminotransferase [Chitinophagales bacterium]|jgi:branched-chain amino acid aminotransferase|nr:branched-chain amino acid aminotransferase [Chitinophagales bacterium]